jgi:outer membrane protein assembly factor BamB
MTMFGVRRRTVWVSRRFGQTLAPFVVLSGAALSAAGLRACAEWPWGIRTPSAARNGANDAREPDLRLLPAAEAPSATATAGALLGEPAPTQWASASRERTPTELPESEALPGLGCSHQDARRTHRVSATGPVQPVLRWKVGGLGPLAAQPIASWDEQLIYVASLAGALSVISSDGVLLRKIDLGGRAYGAPCIAEDGSVFVGSDAARFFSIAPDGAIRWQLEVDGEADSAPVFWPDGMISFAAGPQLYSVTRTGTIRNRFAAGGKIFAAPALHPHGFVVVASQDDHVYAVDSRGIAKWSVDLGADVDGAPTIADDGAIFVGTDAGAIVKISPHGTILFRTDMGGFVRGPLSNTRNGDLVVGVYGPRARVVRMNGQTGAVSWVFPVPGTGAREFGVHGGALEDMSGTLYIGAQDDRVYALRADGTVRWSFLTGGDVDAPVTLLRNGRLIVASDDGTVYGLESASSAPVVQP